MADEEGKNSQVLTRTGEAVVKRLIQFNRESPLASTGPVGIPAPQQSQIIRGCYQRCLGLVADNINESPDATVSDEVSRLILDTLFILQEERPPPRQQLCLGLRFGHYCGRQITRIRQPWGIHLHNMDVTVKLSHPAGSNVVNGISMLPGIRAYNHPRLCGEHEVIMNEMLKTVLLSKAFRDEVIDSSDQAPTGFRRNHAWSTSTFDEDTEVILAFFDHSFQFL